MITPTGTPIELHRGGVRAEVGTIAAVLRSLSVDGADLVEPTPADRSPSFGNGIVLAPWPNRVRDGEWRLDGEVQRLDITERDRGNALHGLLRNADYAIETQRDDMVQLRAFIPPQHGWPFAMQTGVRYQLEDDGLSVTHSVQNLSDRRAPWAVGTHPFLRVGAARIEDCTLQTIAWSYFPVDDRLNATGRPVGLDEENNLLEPRRVGDLRLDTAFGDLQRSTADGEVAWLVAPDGARTALWQTLEWGYLQVFTTPAFSRADGEGFAVAVEPMTAPPDALNSGKGLVWLEPGEHWSGRWGLRHTPAG